MSRFKIDSMLLAALMSLAALPALANSPWDYRTIVVDGGPTDINTAYFLDDVEVASIGYHHATESAPQLWFRFDGEYGDKVHVQIGVPQLERYRALRPVVAIVGPGMPVPEYPLPFDLPPGYGAMLYDTAKQSVENYEESFTGTSSWRYAAEDFFLPAKGDCYIVAFTPNGEEGKFWLAVGEKTKFRFADLLTINQTTREIRTFFEMTSTVSVVFWSQMLALFLLVFLAIFAVSPR